MIINNIDRLILTKILYQGQGEGSLLKDHKAKELFQLRAI